MKILSPSYFDNYKRQLTVDVKKAINEMGEIELNAQNFAFYTSVAVISSSRIEGEPMEIDSYVKHKTQGIEYLQELTEKPNDLYQAYLFAGQNKLTLENLLQSHRLLSQHLLPEKSRGQYRQNEMVVLEHKTGRIQFEAAPYSIVDSELENLWEDVSELILRKLRIEETFYYASYIHLMFVNIHPFNDGNGRAGRLLEKWFLAQKLGEIAWHIQSEKYYYQHVNDYYQNLNRLGVFYENLDYIKADKFLIMLRSR